LGPGNRARGCKHKRYKAIEIQYPTRPTAAAISMVEKELAILLLKFSTIKLEVGVSAMEEDETGTLDRAKLLGLVLPPLILLGTATTGTLFPQQLVYPLLAQLIFVVAADETPSQILVAPS
jgi:hypothetical protein